MSREKREAVKEISNRKTGNRETEDKAAEDKETEEIRLTVERHCVQVEDQDKAARFFGDLSLEGFFAEAGANFITVHREACGENLKNVLRLIKNCGAHCGVVVNPDTPLREVYDCLELCDMLLIMSVYPGLGGQKFIDYVLPKVEEARRIFDAQGIGKDIEIDGGITEENVRRVKDAGANVIVTGNTVFKSDDMAKTIANLRTL